MGAFIHKKGNIMTWLDILSILEDMPHYLLKEEAELWKYTSAGKVEVLPIHHLVNPKDDDSTPHEWEKGGDYHLSLQSFEDEPEPKPEWHTYLVNVDAIMSQTVRIEAASENEAREELEALLRSGELYDEYLEGGWNEDAARDTVEIHEIVEWDGDGEYPLVKTKVEVPKPYTVRINRLMDVEIYAKNDEEAEKIGCEITAGNDVDICHQVNDVMCGCNDEFVDAWQQEDEGSEYCELVLTHEECERLLAIK